MRESTANVYLRPAMGRANLDVVVNAHVTKVILTHLPGQFSNERCISYFLAFHIIGEM